MAANSQTRRRLVGKIGAIRRHYGPDDPRLAHLRTAEAALAIGEIADWARTAAARLPAFDPAAIRAAASAAARIDARLGELPGDGS
jgi:hypothetical protein